MDARRQRPTGRRTSVRTRQAAAHAAALALCWATSRWEPGRVEAQEPDPAVLQQHAQAGERALAEGRYVDAQQAYETLRRLTPGTGEIHARLGLIYFQQGRFAEAIPPLQDALRLKPHQPKVEALLAMSLSELGRFAQAVPALDRAFRPPTDPALRRMAGLHLLRAYTGLRRDEDAVDVALRLSRLCPDDPEVLYHTGRVFANFAYVQTMRLSTVAPGSVWLHQAAGESNESLGLHDAAIREYRRVLAMTPRRPGIHHRLGRVLLARSPDQPSAADALEARQAFEAELAIDPTNANAAYELGELARREGDLERALRLFERAMARESGFEQARVGLARTLIALGRPADAVAHLIVVLSQNPGSEIAHYQSAEAYRAIGDTAAEERALEAFNRLRSERAARLAALPQPREDVTPQVADRATPP
jgi:tetratricopeptide (TPR) repeat protein